jgi:hypothetical protein
MGSGLACTKELMTGGGGDVHLLHVTLTPSTGRHPSRAIVQLCLLWLGSDFQAEEEPLDQLAFLRCSWLQVCLFSIHESALVMK